MRRIGAYLYIAASWLLAHSPKFILYGVADFIYFILYKVIKYRKKVVIKNLTHSFPEKSEDEIIEITRKFFHHLSDLFVENMAIIRMSKKRFLSMVEYKNTELLNDLYSKNKSIVGIIGHYGNWEILPAISFFTQYEVLSVYKPLSNKFFDHEFFKMRRRLGSTPVSMNDTFKTIISYEREKKLYILGLIADQRPQKGRASYWTTFLNQETAVFLGPDKIARKFNSAVFYTHIDKIKRGKYLVEFTLLYENPKDCKEYEITERHVQILEEKIRQKPELWLWSHKRWKYKREIEN
ncbi:MAG TPA: lysophospholipid acyltransferase family protein [Bacteroidales bacterium]|nr:lysophospholipid acyltransferase family protein [Bacteroidales bacterium]